MPRWAQSIRFRLSLAYALAVFAIGTLLLSVLMLWQMQQLDEEITLERRRLILQDAATGQQFDTQTEVFTQGDLFQVFLDRYEQAIKRENLRDARNASLVGLGLLVVVAFGTGWLLSGWALRPMGRMAAVARDISGTELSRRIGLRGPEDELKDLADTFDEMLDRLQASFEDQRRFVQDASHELRNPLAVTQANLELVIDDPDASPDELRAAAQVAHASTERLSHIVDDLVSAARQGVPSHRSAGLDLETLSADIAAEFEVNAASRGIRIETTSSFDGGDRSGTAGAVVNGDEAAIRRAVTNLVVNAVRLAPEGSKITITTGIDEGDAMIAVSDEGPGIEAGLHDAVFERFWRGDDSGKGLGLGLSIVRQVAERHGGTVDLCSDIGVGSTFTIRLPMPVFSP
ncbi:MAG: sensor histidine kinase [Acidimicrobiales bacterium]